MLTLFTLIAVAFTITTCFIAMAVVAAIVKFTFYAILWPLKLLVLPFVLIALIIKFALIVTFVTIAAAILIPIAVVGLIFAAPLIFLSALA